MAAALACGLAAMWSGAGWHGDAAAQEMPAELEAVLSAERSRVEVIARVRGAVVAIFGKDRQGGGSGVLYSADGDVLTNYHVASGAGGEGLAGLPDGRLYKWTTVGVDPGGDLAVIRLSPREEGGRFPFAELGDSSRLRVGEWCMAMGNPFVLADDYSPTVTLGIVSGVDRWQGGEPNPTLLVYGRCVQVDSSINPGNSGGPLFDMAGRVVGINGRGSFEERGRVNVGVGYAISTQQVRLFLAELEAGKVAAHATLDATFADRGGAVVCDAIDTGSAIAAMGLRLGDRLVSFDGEAMGSANQLLNALSTLPAGWPVQVTWDREGVAASAWLRLPARQYVFPSRRPGPGAVPKGGPGGEPGGNPGGDSGEAKALMPLVNVPAGQVRDAAVNEASARRVLQRWSAYRGAAGTAAREIEASEQVLRYGQVVGQRSVVWSATGRETVEQADARATFPLMAPDGAEAGATAGDEAYALKVPGATLARLLLGGGGEAEWRSVVLEGVDRTQNQAAYRIVVEDAAGVRTRLWLSLFDADGRMQTRLLKIAPGGDEPGGDGLAMVFFDYRLVDGVMLPHARQLVRGLEERVVVEAKATSMRWRGGNDVAGATATAAAAAAAVVATPAPAATGGEAAMNARARGTSGNLFAEAVATAQRRCVRIYGGAIGRERGYATGLIVSEQGDIVTAHGVYTTQDEVRVVMPDGAQRTGKVVRRDEAIQAALVRVETATPEYYRLAAAPEAQTGQWVVAVGNWFNIAGPGEPLSATAGVLSLTTEMDTKRRFQDMPIEGRLLVVDAITANPGAAGGALLDMDGQLLGMVGKVVESRSTGTRLNYAIPAERLRALVEGRATEVVRGGTAAAASADTGLRLFMHGGLSAPAYVDSVRAGSPAAAAGLRQDDLVLRVGEVVVRDVRECRAALAKMTPGVPTVLVLKRKNEVLQVTLTAKAVEPAKEVEREP